jgi:hypothetical protein
MAPSPSSSITAFRIIFRTFRPRWTSWTTLSPMCLNGSVVRILESNWAMTERVQVSAPPHHQMQEDGSLGHHSRRVSPPFRIKTIFRLVSFCIRFDTLRTHQQTRIATLISHTAPMRPYPLPILPVG